MKIAEINMMHTGSTGKIMFGIADCARKNGHIVRTFSPVVFFRHRRMEKADIPEHTYFGTRFENAVHTVLGEITGFQGCFSFFGTKQLINELERFQPDIIHLHNLHNHCIDIPMLFRYIKSRQVKVVWTLHDCWALTGQCPYFTSAKCEKWKTGCNHCPQTREYLKAYVDQTKTMWKLKKKWFTGIENMVLTPPSQWLADLIGQSYLKEYPTAVINNGIDLDLFKPTDGEFRAINGLEHKNIVLGVAFDWGRRKGLDVFIQLSRQLPRNYQIVLVGTNEQIDQQLPKNIISIHRTQNQQELAQIYTAADVFAIPTREDNYPTVNMEALACGTPVVTFNTGGSAEMLDETCGSVVLCDDVDAMEKEIVRICEQKPYTREACVLHAKKFDMNNRFKEYVDLYESETYTK